MEDNKTTEDNKITEDSKTVKESYNSEGLKSVLDKLNELETKISNVSKTKTEEEVVEKNELDSIIEKNQAIAKDKAIETQVYKDSEAFMKAVNVIKGFADDKYNLLADTLQKNETLTPKVKAQKLIQQVLTDCNNLGSAAHLDSVDKNHLKNYFLMQPSEQLAEASSYLPYITKIQESVKKERIDLEKSKGVYMGEDDLLSSLKTIRADKKVQNAQYKYNDDSNSLNL